MGPASALKAKDIQVDTRISNSSRLKVMTKEVLQKLMLMMVISITQNMVVLL